MILKGSQRCGARALAQHLLNVQDNDHIEVAELNGFIAEDLTGALDEIEAIALGTKCKQPLFSVSINPPEGDNAPDAYFYEAIARIEVELKLAGQPRAVVFHEKNGRRHAHVAWSRINAKTMTAINLPFYKTRLTAISKALFLHYGWHLPQGFADTAQRNPLNMSREEWQQAKRTLHDPIALKRIYVQAWQECKDKNRASFELALREAGLFLARGDRRGYVAVDVHGNIYSLSRWCGVKTKALKALLGDPSELPSIDEVRDEIARLYPQEIKDALKVSKQYDSLEPKKPKTQAELIDILTHHHAAFTVRMMERALYKYCDTREELKHTIAELLTSETLIALPEQNGKLFYTTQAMIDLEQQMIQCAENMADAPSHAVQQSVVKDAIKAFNKQLASNTGNNAILSKQQIKAITHLTAELRLSSLVGVAGAGKTTIMQVVAGAYSKQGYRVRGAALSGIAADGLRETGMTASTLHALELKIKAAENMKRQQSWHSLSKKQQDFITDTLLSKHDVLVIDEAGMVGTRQLARVMQLADKAGAKVILCGDHQQLQSIEAGAAFRNIIERHDYADISEVRRQHTAWMREATNAFATGDTNKALQSYLNNGHITHRLNKREAMDMLVADYMAAHQKRPDASRMVLAYTRKDVNALNKAIKAKMIKAGHVAKQQTELNITELEDDKELRHVQSFGEGDRIMFRQNDTKLGVMNGTLATINKIDRHIVDVTLDNGKSLRFNAKEYTRFQLGYAATVHKSQGVTINDTYVLASKHFDRHTAYVAMTRHRKNVTLYAGKDEFRTTQRLISSLSKEGHNRSTLDFEEDTPAPISAKQVRRKAHLLRQRNTMRIRHRQEREALKAQQTERQREERIARRAMLPSGLSGLWSRFTGKQDVIKEQIRNDIAASKLRDATERHTLIQRQLAEQRKLQQDMALLRQDAQVKLSAIHKHMTYNSMETEEKTLNLQQTNQINSSISKRQRLQPY